MLLQKHAPEYSPYIKEIMGVIIVVNVRYPTAETYPDVLLTLLPNVNFRYNILMLSAWC